MNVSEDHELKQLRLEAEKDKVFEVYEYLKETELEILSCKAQLSELEMLRAECLDVLSGKKPLKL